MNARFRLISVALVVLLSVLVMSACGFHPRGSLVEQGDPDRLFLDTDRDLSIAESLRDALRERSFIVAVNRDQADVILRIANESEAQRILSVRSTGRVSEFELAHSVMLSIRRMADESDGEAVVPRADRVRVTRDYTYDEAQVLGKENEALILREELREELVRQIVLRIVANLASR